MLVEGVSCGFGKNLDLEALIRADLWGRQTRWSGGGCQLWPASPWSRTLYQRVSTWCSASPRYKSLVTRWVEHMLCYETPFCLLWPGNRAARAAHLSSGGDRRALNLSVGPGLCLPTCSEHTFTRDHSCKPGFAFTADFWISRVAAPCHAQLIPVSASQKSLH